MHLFSSEIYTCYKQGIFWEENLLFLTRCLQRIPWPSLMELCYRKLSVSFFQPLLFWFFFQESVFSSTSCVVCSGRTPSVPVQEKDKNNCMVLFCSLGKPSLKSSGQVESYLEFSKNIPYFLFLCYIRNHKRNDLFWKEIDNFTYFSDGLERQVPCGFCMASPPTDVCHIFLCPV